MKRLVCSAVLLFLLPLLTACDSYAEFTVVNTTDQPMTAGWSYNGCPRQNGPPPLLRQTLELPPQGEASFTTVSASEAHCVMVTNATGSLRLYAPYQDYGRYVVRPDAGTPVGFSIALDGALPPAAPLDASSARDVPPVLTYVLGFGVALGVIASLVIMTGHFRSQRRPRRRLRPTRR